jgi:hypothetical protein
MRAKFIFEKFSEESDPIEDMGIGIGDMVKKFSDKMQREEGVSLYKDAAKFLQYFLIYADWNDDRLKQIKIELPKDLIIPMLKYILKQNINLNETGAYIGYQASNLKDRKLKHEVFKLLIDNGLDVTPAKIFEYFKKEDAETVKYITEKGLKKRKEPNATKYKNRILIEASKNNHPEVVKWALSVGADPSIENYIALRGALEDNNKELAVMLAKQFLETEK